MTDKEKLGAPGLLTNAGNLLDEFAKKGGPGILLLGIIVLVIWAPIGLVLWKFFAVLLAQRADGAASLPIHENIWILLAVTVFAAVVVLALLTAAFLLTRKLLTTVVPTVQADAAANALMSGAFGGRALTSLGTLKSIAIGRPAAQQRAMRVIGAIVERVRTVVGTGNIRANLSVLREDGKLHLLPDFMLNMDGPMRGPGEETIAVPSGLLSAGRAYRYYRPVLSVKEHGKWPHMEQQDVKAGELEEEVKKIHADLQWVVSMPIPYQVEPIKLTCGVLNIDGLEALPSDEKLRMLLADLSTAVALIALLNNGTGFIDGLYSMPVQPDKQDEEQLRKHMISPKDFDPADCPEPSAEFIGELSSIEGLHSLAGIPPAVFAKYLREQLRD